MTDSILLFIWLLSIKPGLQFYCVTAAVQINIILCDYLFVCFLLYAIQVRVIVAIMLRTLLIHKGLKCRNISAEGLVDSTYNFKTYVTILVIISISCSIIDLIFSRFHQIQSKGQFLHLTWASFL